MDRPNVTQPQIVGLITAGIPILSALLAAFGVWSPDLSQQEALNDAVTWGGAFGAALVGGDAFLRSARNLSDAKRDAAALAPPLPGEAAITPDPILPDEGGTTFADTPQVPPQ